MSSYFASVVILVSFVAPLHLRSFRALKLVSFSGPTNFSEVIRTAANYAGSFKFSQHEQKYYILLILTGEFQWIK
jgi:hypothetical protein